MEQRREDKCGLSRNKLQIPGLNGIQKFYVSVFPMIFWETKEPRFVESNLEGAIIQLESCIISTATQYTCYSYKIPIYPMGTRHQAYRYKILHCIQNLVILNSGAVDMVGHIFTILLKWYQRIFFEIIQKIIFSFYSV